MAADFDRSISGPDRDVTVDPRTRFADNEAVNAAVDEAMREVRILHKRMGVPLIGSIDGRMVSIPPEEIEIDPPEPTPKPLNP